MAPIIGLAFTLTACGGGGSGGNIGSSGNGSISESPSGINSTRFEALTTYDFTAYSKNTFVTASVSHQDGTISYTDYIKSDPDQPDLDDTILIASDGAYEPDLNKYNLGYRTGVIDYISRDATTLVTTPYNKANLKNLKITTKGEWIDLGSKKVSDHTAVYWGIMAEKAGDSIFFPDYQPVKTKFKNFLALAKTTVFPAGASCFKELSTEYSLPFYQIYPKNSKLFANNVEVKEYQAWVESLGTDIISGKWGNVDWAYAKSQANDTRRFVVEVGVNWQNKPYVAYWEKQPDSTVKGDIAQYEKEMKENPLDEEEKIAYNATIAALQKECTSYNKIAANKIDQLIDTVK